MSINKAVVWGQPHCKACTEAKAILASDGWEVEYREVNDSSKEEFMQLFPSARSVPQIIMNGTVVGGYMNMLKVLEE